MTCSNWIKTGALALFTVTVLSAQTKAVSTGAKIPRGADGHPDLTGVWNNATRTPFERPDTFGGKAFLSEAETREWEAREAQRWQEGATIDGGRPVTIQGGAYNVLFYDNGTGLARYGGQNRTSMVVDPPDGHIPPVLPEARNRVRRGATVAGDYKSLSNDTRCLVGNTSAVPMTPALYNDNYQIVQSPDSILIVLEMVHDGRIVHMNAKHQPPSVRQWFGDSIGHWDNDTLVVETTNFSDQSRYRGSSKDLKVTERFTRVSDKTIEYRATMEDPSTWAKPWSLELPFNSVPGPLYEYACHEGNYAILGILGGK